MIKCKHPILAITEVVQAIVKSCRGVGKQSGRLCCGSTCCCTCMHCFCNCCPCLSTRCMRYVSANIYILTAIHGSGFCQSFNRIGKLLMPHPIRAIIITQLSNIILLTGKLCVAISCSTLAWGIFSNHVVVGKK